MEAIWVAFIGQAGAIAVIIVTYLLQKRRITNGLATTQQEIHNDIRDVVMPTLVELAEWRNGYRGTIWANKEAIDAWVATNDFRHAVTNEQVAELAGKLAVVDDEVREVKNRLVSHDEWERHVKYGLGPGGPPSTDESI